MRLIVEMFSGWSLRDTDERMDSLLARVALLAGVLDVGFSLWMEPSLMDRLSFSLGILWLSRIC